jgi:O-antigen/teichoic acid export membrane protein
MKTPLLRRLLAPLRSNQVLSLAGNLVVAGMNLVSMSLLFRALPKGDTGAWIVFITAVGLADAFRTGFITTAFIRSYAGATPERAAEVVGSAWTIALTLTAGIAAFNGLARLLPLPFSNGAGLTLILGWLGIVTTLTLPTFMAAIVLQSELRFGAILVLRLLSQGLFVLGIISLMVSGHMQLNYVLTSYVLAASVTTIVALAMGWTGLRGLPHRTRACVSELAHFGKFSVGSYVGSSLLRSSDTFIVNALLGPAALAVYNLAQRFVELIELPMRSFLSTAIPALSAAFNKQNLPEVGRLLRKNAGLLTWALTPLIVVTILLADLPIALIGGSKYAGTPAANLLRIIILLTLLIPIDRFIGVTLDVINQPRINLQKVFLMLAVNVTGDLIGILVFKNIYGVALASLPTVITGFLFGYFQLRRFMPLSLRDILQTGLAEAQALLRALWSKARPLTTQ